MKLPQNVRLTTNALARLVEAEDPQIIHTEHCVYYVFVDFTLRIVLLLSDVKIVSVSYTTSVDYVREYVEQGFIHACA